jgi:O-acetyl-ADP-ribose deacetylase (regulator of RNase III)
LARFPSREIAAEHGIRTLAFPGISTGIYGYPAELAAPVAYRTVTATAAYLASIEEVIFCCFSADDLAVYAKLLASSVG